MSSRIRRSIDAALLRLAWRLERLAAEEHLRLQRGAATMAPSATVHPTAHISNLRGGPGAIAIGAHTEVWGDLVVLWEGGSIRIGEQCYLGERCNLTSLSSITIGNRVVIFPFVDVLDTDSHPMTIGGWRQDLKALITNNPDGRRGLEIGSSPVVIEDDVCIGAKATVLKGVRIGQGAVVAPGAIVVKDVPAGSVVAGNPARVVA